MSDNKIQTQIPVANGALQLDRNYTANQDGDMVNERGEVCGSVDYETGKVDINMSDNIVVNNINGVLITTNFDAAPTHKKGNLVCNKVTMQLAPMRFGYTALKK